MDTLIIPTVVAYKVVTYGVGTTIVGPLFLTFLGYGGLSSVVAVVVVAISEPSGGGTGANILGLGGGCARWGATRFSSALIRLGSNVHWSSII